MHPRSLAALDLQSSAIAALPHYRCPSRVCTCILPAIGADLISRSDITFGIFGCQRSNFMGAVGIAPTKTFRSVDLQSTAIATRAILPGLRLGLLPLLACGTRNTSRGLPSRPFGHHAGSSHCIGAGGNAPPFRPYQGRVITFLLHTALAYLELHQGPLPYQGNALLPELYATSSEGAAPSFLALETGLAAGPRA